MLWCGKFVSVDGFRQNLERIQALIELSDPWIEAIDLRSKSDAKLRTGLCWSYPATASSDGIDCDCSSWWSHRRKNRPHRDRMGWQRKSLSSPLLRSHIATQIPVDQRMRSLAGMEHQPLMFLVEPSQAHKKHRTTVVEACKRAGYLLHIQQGFHLYTVHRSLKFMFDPHAVYIATLQRYATYSNGIEVPH